MKIFKKIASGFLAFAIALSAIPMGAIPVRATAAEGNSLRLWYDEPVSKGNPSGPMGGNYNSESNYWQ